MNDTFQATYKKGVLVPLENPRLKDQQTVRLQIVPAQVAIGASAARKKVNRFLLDEVSYLMGAGQPSLVEAGRLFWRVPVDLTSPDKGIVGQVGTLDVDAETGELAVDPKAIEEMLQNAHKLAGSSPSPTAPSI